ncbi:MAG: BCD family MFS transporter [Betaproteobacteria bacterium]|nr:BCD family MFS transporter [Betaproteobacteria bacterium]
MNTAARRPTLAAHWRRVSVRLLPFADVASADLPISKLLRLSLFQVSVGMATVLLVGTLNRVMIVELGVHAWLVAAMASLPLLFAPFRTLIGYKSDTHQSALGWRRVPYIWMGTLTQFGGLAIMPFALLVLSGDSHGPAWVGTTGAALAFLLVGAGMQVTQTTGLALATDLATPASRPRVVALMYVMLLLGMVVSGMVFGLLLADFSQLRLIQVVQGAALVTMALNIAALWKQEGRGAPRPMPAAGFRTSWRMFARHRHAVRFLIVVGLGTTAFNMQDIILEPYGGEILNLSVGSTTTLTALLSAGALCAFALSARLLRRGANAHRLAAVGLLMGVAAFATVIFAAPLESPALFRIGTLLIGFGGGLFAVSTLITAMNMEIGGHIGLALGAWGAVQACAAGVAIAAGGALRDGIGLLATHGWLGSALATPATGYSFVYHAEIALLFITLVVLGPLVARAPDRQAPRPATFGLADFPG